MCSAMMWPSLPHPGLEEDDNWAEEPRLSQTLAGIMDEGPPTATDIDAAALNAFSNLFVFGPRQARTYTHHMPKVIPK